VGRLNDASGAGVGNGDLAVFACRRPRFEGLTIMVDVVAPAMPGVVTVAVSFVAPLGASAKISPGTVERRTSVIAPGRRWTAVIPPG
jgi:hypothetical protein